MSSMFLSEALFFFNFTSFHMALLFFLSIGLVPNSQNQLVWLGVIRSGWVSEQSEFRPACVCCCVKGVFGSICRKKYSKSAGPIFKHVRISFGPTCILLQMHSGN